MIREAVNLFEPGAAGALLGLAAAFFWGVADFTGGVASRRASALLAAIALNLIGVVLSAGLAIWQAEPFPTLSGWLWGLAAGASGVLGLVALYQALADGKMGIAAPLTGVLAAGVPVVFSALFEGLPSPMQLTGFALALIGVWLVSAADGRITLNRGLALPIMAGLAFGAFYVLINQSTGQGVYWPLVAAKIASLAMLAILSAFRKPTWQPGGGLLLLLLAVGVMDAGGNIFFLLASQAGRLDVAAVLSSLYPAGTVLCAWIILKERLSRRQVIGIIGMLVAILLIAG